MHNEAAIGKSLRPIRLQVYHLPQKRAPFFAFFHKTRANTQQVLPVQTGLYRYDE